MNDDEINDDELDELIDREFGDDLLNLENEDEENDFNEDEMIDI